MADDVDSLIELLSRVKEDWDANGKDWTRPGFQALAVHRFGNWRMSIGTKAVRAPFSVVHRACERFVRNVYGIELPYSAKVGRRVVIEHQGGIVIHGNSVIGDECIIRQGVTLGMKNVERANEAPTLERGVNVGAGAVILGPITIGEGANVGANAVVTKDVEAGATAVGIPARVVAKGDIEPSRRRDESAAQPVTPKQPPVKDA